MILGKYIEGCTRGHTTILDQWEKGWSKQLRPAIQDICNETERRHHDGRLEGC